MDIPVLYIDRGRRLHSTIQVVSPLFRVSTKCPTAVRNNVWPFCHLNSLLSDQKKRAIKLGSLSHNKNNNNNNNNCNFAGLL